METNNTDKAYRNAFKSRTLTPSNSAWERLHKQLDKAQEQKRKKRFTYLGYAAGMALLISLSFVFTQNDDFTMPPSDIETVEISIPTLTTPAIKTPPLINTIEETVIANADTHKKIKQKKINPIEKDIFKRKEVIFNKIENFSTLKSTTNTSAIILANTTFSKNKTKKRKIHIDAQALLKAAMEEPEENSFGKQEKLALIKTEIAKYNITLDPSEILADVERDINDTSFKANFMKALKSNISTLTTAIADRNK